MSAKLFSYRSNELLKRHSCRLFSADLRLAPEVFNQLRMLQKKAREIRQDVRTLRKASQNNSIQISGIVAEAAAKIT